MRCNLRLLTFARGLAAATLLLFGSLPLAVQQPATAATPGITLSRALAAPGDTVTVTGTGFHAGGTAVVAAAFTVRTGSGTPTKTPVSVSTPVAASGQFKASLTVPSGAVPAKYALTARDFSGSKASATMRIIRLIHLISGKQGPSFPIVAGHPFYVDGSGFSPGETVKLSADFPLYDGNTLTVTKSATADKNGAFGETLMQAPWRAKDADVLLSATGSQSGSSRVASAKIAIIHRPLLSLASTTARPGGSVAIHGVGFVPGAQITVSVTIPRPGNSALTLSKTVTAGTQGDFVASLNIPTSAGQGTFKVSAVGSVAGFKVSTLLKVAVSAGISIKPASILPGQTVKVVGSGFSAGAQIQVSTNVPLYGGGSKTISTSATTNGNGDFALRLQVPARAAAGPVTVVAKGPNTQSTARLQISHIAAHIVLAPAAIRPGSDVTIQGSGYLAGAKIEISTAVHLTNGTSQALTATTTTNGKGQFSIKLHVPSNVIGGTYAVVAKSALSGRARTALLSVGKLAPSIVVAPASVVPGTKAAVKGSGFLPGSKITLSVAIQLSNGSKQTLTATTTTDASGKFFATVQIPGNAAGGTYSLSARSAAGRSAGARLIVGKLAPQIVAVPTTGVPGTPVTVNGFGFAPGQTVTVYLNGQKMGTATTGTGGQFSLKVTIPSDMATGSYGLSAASSAGRKASIQLRVNRTISTHFYFASLYTGRGYHEYLDFLNPTSTRGQVQITYEPTVGSPKSKTIGIGPHSRVTEDVNADVGVHVSTAAAVSADVAIVASRMVMHGTDGAIVPGTTAPSTVWYFANGNTNHAYREFVAVQNPSNGPVQVTLHLQPTHHRPFTVVRNMAPTSRTTFKINSLVRDAVGVTVTASGPVVANRTTFIHHGMTSKIGVTSPQLRWYFAAGPHRNSASNWLGVINTSSHRSFLTLRAYGPAGSEVGAVRTWIKPFAREGYLINKIAHQANVSVLVTTSRPSVVEQTTYFGRMHNAATDTFGAPRPAKAWEYASAQTGPGQTDILSLFNPNLAPIGVAVQYMTASGSVMQRTYIVPPLSQLGVDVGSIAPNAQLGIVAASSEPFVALNRQIVDSGQGAMTSIGIAR